MTENWQGEKMEITVAKGDDRTTKEEKLGNKRINDRNTMKYKMMMSKGSKD